VKILLLFRCLCRVG